MFRKLRILFTRSIKSNTSGESQVRSHAQAGFTFSPLVPMRLKKYRAFSFVEAIIIVLFLGIFAAIAVPRLNLASISTNKAQVTAGKIVSDLRLTRRLAISDAANNTIGFGIRMVGGPYYTGYAIINLNTSVTVGSHNIDPAVSCKGYSNFEFGPLGNLKEGSGTELYIDGGGKSIAITIIPATGTVKCSEN